MVHMPNMPRILLAATAAVWLGSAQAHQDEDHVPADAGTPSDTGQAATTAITDPSAMPFPVDLGGSFSLVDHNGLRRTDKDFRGDYMLVFFGYVNCQSMCTVALHRIAKAVDKLGDDAKRLQAVMITVDPENDTPEVMRAELAKLHPRLLGLTGSADELAEAYDAYRIKPGAVGADAHGNTVINHTSYAYLTGPKGKMLTLLPPILGPERMAEILAKYMSAEG
ncbi:MAG: SCO family protein [Gammaproteobacteria bacterium]